MQFIPMRGKRAAILAAAICALFAVDASAAVPTTSTIEGALTSAGGGAAADGSYSMTFSLYTALGAKTATWTEAGVKLDVKGGRFAYALGTTKALDAKVLAGMAQAWLGITIGTDPELPRQRVHATPFALVAEQANGLACTSCVGGAALANGGISASKIGFNYAASTNKGGPAIDLACTGCVSVNELKFDGNVDLGAYSLKAKNGTFTGDVAATTITATGFIGDGSKLTGLKMPKGSCAKAGEVVKGINADGTLLCVAALDPTALPKDGLNEISNDLISNQFVDTITTTQKLVPIPDFQGKEAISNITFPNIGTAQTFSVSVHVENTDLSVVSMVILPPNDKKVGWKLCDPCGAKDSKIYKKTFTPTAKPKSGDVGYWIGKNPQGLWNLKVLDNGFCILQASGNAKYCDPVKKTDGWIATWSIKIQTLSNQKIAVNGDQYNSGSINLGKDATIGGNLTLGKPGTCSAATLGSLSWDAKYGLRACHKNWPKSGAVSYKWVAAKASPVIWSGGCTSHNQQGGWRLYCLNGVDYDYSQSHFTRSTSGRLTINVSGFYRMKFYAIQHGCGQQDLAIRVNGSQKACSHDNAAVNGAQGWRQHQLQYTAPLKIGDYIEPWTYHDGCGNQYNWHLWNANGSHSRVTFEYVGPLPD